MKADGEEEEEEGKGDEDNVGKLRIHSIRTRNSIDRGKCGGKDLVAVRGANIRPL